MKRVDRRKDDRIGQERETTSGASDLKEVLMLNKRSLALAGALTVLPQMVLAAATGQCVDVSVPKKAIEARNGKWIELTPDQWQFLRGIYAMSRETPPGLPYGDKAAL